MGSVAIIVAVVGGVVVVFLGATIDRLNRIIRLLENVDNLTGERIVNSRDVPRESLNYALRERERIQTREVCTDKSHWKAHTTPATSGE